MNIGFTGTRDGMTDAQRAELGTWFMFDSNATVFRHGSCKGADVEAAQLMRYVRPRVEIIAHPGPDDDPCRTVSGVDDEIQPGETHFARNRRIVDRSELLVATPKHMTEQARGGTWYTINYAKKKGKRVIIFWPDRTILDIPGKAPA